MTLDSISLNVDGFSVEEEISQTLGPCMRDHFQRDSRFQDKLGVTCFRGCVDVRVGDMGTSRLEQPSARFTVSITGPPSDPLTKKSTLDLMAFIPHEHVVSLKTEYSLGVPEWLFVAMANIETLSLHEVILSGGFPQPNPEGPHAKTKLFPSLRTLRLWHVTADDAGWGPLTAYLAHQTFDDGRTVSVELMGYCSHLSPEVAKEVRKLAEAFVFDPILDVENSDEEGNESEGDCEEDESGDDWEEEDR